MILRSGRLFVLLLGGSLSLLVQGASPPPDRVAKFKAVYLYHFSNFLQWPENGLPEKTFTLCMPHGHPITEHLGKLEGRRAQGRQLEIREIAGPDSVQGCQILYVGATRLPVDWVDAHYRSVQPIVTVGDGPEFARCCGMIGFFLEGARLRFAISAARVKEMRVGISSKLLRLAEIVD